MLVHTWIAYFIKIEVFWMTIIKIFSRGNLIYTKFVRSSITNEVLLKLLPNHSMPFFCHLLGFRYGVIYCLVTDSGIAYTV